jgi:hypothetical protein
VREVSVRAVSARPHGPHDGVVSTSIWVFVQVVVIFIARVRCRHRLQLLAFRGTVDMRTKSAGRYEELYCIPELPPAIAIELRFWVGFYVVVPGGLGCVVDIGTILVAVGPARVTSNMLDDFVGCPKLDDWLDPPHCREQQHT